MSIFTKHSKSMMNLYLSDDKRKGFPVVFLHGNSIDHTVFEGLRDIDGKNSLRHILIDMPGHGLSPKMPFYTLDKMAEALCGFLNHSLTEDYCLVAHSLSGHIIINTLKRLKNIKGLILIGTPPLTSCADLPFAFNQSPTRLLYKGSWNDAELSEISRLYSNEKPEIISSALPQCDRKFKSDFLLPAFLEKFSNEHDIIRSIGLPIAITWSSNDLFVNTGYIKAQIPLLETQNVCFNEFQKGGHSPFMDTPNAFYSYLNVFIESIL